MASSKTKYLISFGIDKCNNLNIINFSFIANNLEILEEFEFYDYNASSNIGNLKEFFLTTFGQKYQFCRCEISVYNKVNKEYRRLSCNEESRLSQFNIERFYLIKTKNTCNCEFKEYNKYNTIPKFEIITKLKNLDINISKLEQSNERLTIKNSENRSKLEKLIAENLKLKKEIEMYNKKDELKYIIKQKPEDYYDIIIGINSIKKINKEGWKVKFKEKGFDNYNQFKDKDLVKIGVLGEINKGKSFILSKISNIKLPTGIHTEGLSVKYPDLKGHKERYLILLDSRGMQTPVLKNNNEEPMLKENELEKEKSEKSFDEFQNDKEFKQNKEFKENSKDNLLTNLFLQNFILNVSDILLVIVGELTYSEQLLITKIKIEAQKQNKSRIFIIHNLKEFITKEQVENYIHNCLLKCSKFDITKRTRISIEKDKDENQREKYIKQKNEIKNREIKIKEEDKKEDNIKQKNEIENGEIRINLIRDEIRINQDHDGKNEEKEIEDNNNEDKFENEKEGFNNTHFTEILNYGDKRQLEVYHLIMANEYSEAGEFFNQYSYDFLRNIFYLQPNPKQFDIFKKIEAYFKEYLNITSINEDIVKSSFSNQEEILKDKIIKLNFDNEIFFKKAYIDELGFSIFKTRNFEPKYNYFKPDEKTLEIRLEIPGNVKCAFSHKIIGDETIITVRGRKMPDKYPERLKDYMFNLREFTDFELNIPLKVEDFVLKEGKTKEGYPKIINGICIVQYELVGRSEENNIISSDPDF